jgi:alkanesulfonate monooxygenase SsuD/methylene tetrahydromethanopterin reductase-like flavin-dependent oxidoreductase (luciferase family)
LLAALTQDVVDYHGRYFNYTNVPIELKPLQQPHPPLWYGTASPETAAMAARQNANIVSLQTAGAAKIPIARYKEVWQEAHGGHARQMPRVGLTRFLYVGETARQAEERGKFGFEKFYDSFTYLWRKFGAVPAGLDDPSQMRKEMLIAGTAADVREQIGRELQECGANYFVPRFAYGNLTHEESVRSLELFAAEVMPHFQK